MYWSYFPADRLTLIDKFGNYLQWPAGINISGGAYSNLENFTAFLFIVMNS